jgi:hypothetical protein
MFIGTLYAVLWVAKGGLVAYLDFYNWCTLSFFTGWQGLAGICAGNGCGEYDEEKSHCR